MISPWLLLFPVLLPFLYFGLKRILPFKESLAEFGRPNDTFFPREGSLVQIAQELNRPLTLLRLTTDTLLSRSFGSLGHEDQQTLLAIHHNLGRLEEAIKQIAFAGDGTSKLYTALHLPGFAAAIRDSLKNMANSRNIGFQYALDLEADTEFLLTDSLKLEKIILNLLLNAFSCSPDGGSIYLLLKTHISREGLIMLQCTVSDRDSGIQAPDTEYSCRVDYPTNGDLAPVNIAGPSLLLTAEIAQAIGGSLQAQTHQDGSTAFTLMLKCPKAPALRNQRRETARSAEYMEYLPDEPVGTVHIIDADQETRGWFAACLNGYFKVYTFSNTATFEQFVTNDSDNRNISFDAVLFNVTQPDRGGIETIQSLRHFAFLKNTPLLAFSTGSPSSRLDRVLYLDFDDYFLLPVAVSELLLRIMYVMRRYKMRFTGTDVHTAFTTATQAPNFIASQNILLSVPEDKKIWMTQLLQIIEAHLNNERLGASLLAQNMSISKRQLFRIIREATGFSPNQLIHEIRMVKAFHLLKSRPDLLVSDIAYSVGIDNPSYFTVAFKKRFNKSPSTARF